MTIQKNLVWATRQLKNKRIFSAMLDAEILLSFVLKKPRSYLFIWPKKKISEKQELRYEKIIERRAKSEPVAYLTNKKEFYGLDFFVDKNVLIPRPETESLVEEILKHVRISIPKSRITIADIGTGSGCIAITLKKYFPKARVYASDLSTEALKVCQKNAHKHKVKIFIKHGDLLEPFKKNNLDIIVANLPYLKPNLTKHPGLKFEPIMALAAGKQGLDLYRRFFGQMRKYQPKAKGFIEIEADQGMAIKRIVKKNLPKAQVEIKKDLASRDRIAIIH